MIDRILIVFLGSIVVFLSAILLSLGEPKTRFKQLVFWISSFFLSFAIPFFVVLLLSVIATFAKEF